MVGSSEGSVYFHIRWAISKSRDARLRDDGYAVWEEEDYCTPPLTDVRAGFVSPSPGLERNKCEIKARIVRSAWYRYSYLQRDKTSQSTGVPSTSSRETLQMSSGSGTRVKWNFTSALLPNPSVNMPLECRIPGQVPAPPGKITRLLAL